MPRAPPIASCLRCPVPRAPCPVRRPQSEASAHDQVWARVPPTCGSLHTDCSMPCCIPAAGMAKPSAPAHQTGSTASYSAGGTAQRQRTAASTSTMPQTVQAQRRKPQATARAEHCAACRGRPTQSQPQDLTVVTELERRAVGVGDVEPEDNAGGVALGVGRMLPHPHHLHRHATKQRIVVPVCGVCVRACVCVCASVCVCAACRAACERAWQNTVGGWRRRREEEPARKPPKHSPAASCGVACARRWAGGRRARACRSPTR